MLISALRHLLLCAAQAAFAPEDQGTVEVGLGEPVPLPSISYQADHGTVAVNDRGDVLVAFHTAVSAGSQVSKQIEAVFVRRIGKGRWLVPSVYDSFLLGDSSVGLAGPADRCDKPDVVSVGNDFLVCFPRGPVSSSGGSGLSRLELVIVRVDDQGVASLDVPGPGQGWVIDPGFTAGQAGAMPDLVHRTVDPDQPGASPEGRAAVVYARQTEHEGVRQGFELVGAALDVRSSPPVIGPLETLVSKIPVDSTNGYPGGGGRVLPDLVEDDLGHLVLAHEFYALAARGVTTTDEGQLWIRRFEAPLAGGFRQRDALMLNGEVLHFRQRRPALMGSRYDGENVIGLAWPELSPDSLRSKAHYGLLQFPAGGGIQFQNALVPNPAKAKVLRPIPVHAEGFQGCMLDLDWQNGTRDTGGFRLLPAPTTMILDSAGLLPERNAVDVGEGPTFGGPGQRVMARVYEAVPAGLANERVYLILHRM